MYHFIDSKKLTKTEWAVEHKKDICECRYNDFEGKEYWYCNTYEAYCAEYDEQMAIQIHNRDIARRQYLRLKHSPYSDEWEEVWSDFSDTFKGVYGYRPRYRASLLQEKGIVETGVV